MAGEFEDDEDKLFADLKGGDDDDDDGKKGGGKKDAFEQLLDIEDDNRDKPFAFADDDDERPENAERRARTRAEMEEIVFAEDDDDDGDGDIEDFSKGGDKDKKKSNRLQREIRQKTEARKVSHQLLGVVREAEKQATAALQAEARNRRDAAQMVMNFANSDYRRLTTEMARAKEDGDTDRIEELTGQMANARDAYNKAEAVIADLSDEKIAKITYRADVPALPKMTKGQDWTDQNPWFNDPKYAAERAAAIEIDRQLLKEGGNADSDEHFVNLTKKIAQKFPQLTREGLLHTSDGRTARLASDGGRRRGGSGKRDVTGSSSRGGGSGTGSGQSRGERGGKEFITKEERRMMQALGIDLADENHRKEFTRNMVK